MIARAKGRFLPVSTRKIRSVARLLRGVGVPRAQMILRHLPKAACAPVGKVLKSAVANAARKREDLKPGDLVISRILADGGPIVKRYRAGAMGRAMEIHKRMTHLTIELDTPDRGEGHGPQG